MSERADVLIDMDGVVADFEAHTEAKMLELYPHIELIRPRSNFYMHEDYAPEYHEVIRSIQAAKHFFREFPLIDGALEGWQRLIDFGYNPRICTAPLSINLECAADKIWWLEKHFVPVFGKKVVEHAIIDGDKAAHPGLALIDDRPEIRDADKASWTHILFEQPYNLHVQTDFRMHGWQDPSLPELLERAKALAA